MKSPNDLSFLPDDYLDNKAQRRANVICAILFLVTMVSIGLAFTTSEASLRKDEQINAQVNDDFTNAAKRIEQFKQMQEKQRTMAHQAELTASLLEKVPRSLILAKITNSLPQGVSLTDFLLTSSKRNTMPAARTAFEAKASATSIVGQVADAKVYDVSLKIGGLAPTDVQVGDLLKKLKAIPMFKDVNLIITDWDKGGDKKSNDEQQYRKFQIEMTLDPNADLDDASGPATASLGLNK
jgi:Tfp pilus assembly protein PilN